MGVCVIMIISWIAGCEMLECWYIYAFVTVLVLFFFFFFFFSFFSSFFLTHNFVVDNVQRRELVNVYGYSAV